MRIYPDSPSFTPINFDKLEINKRKCNVIVLKKQNNKDNKTDSKAEEDLCGCLKKISLHHKEVIENYQNNPTPETKWNRDDCTIDDGKTDAYGEILFPGNENPSRYIRVSYKTEMEKILKLLFEKNYWNLKKPELIISVTGGAEKISLSEKLKEAFSRGLVNAATTTNAIVTSGGTFGGCMKLVGEAFKENALSIDPNQKVTVLGIASWCSLFNNTKLIRDPKEKYDVVDYELIKPRGEKKSLLDPNHSHFLMIDDAFNYFGGELEFRADLEAKLAEKYSIPIVVLVIGGGPNTADSVLKAVKKGTPCVFLESSGEMEHGFSFAINKVKKFYENLQPEQSSPTNPFSDPIFMKEIENKLKKGFLKKPDNVKKILDNKYIENCLEKKYLNLLTVCRSTNGNAELDVAILEALLNAKKGVDGKTNQEEFQSQLKLALKWNRIDIARNYLFTEENRDLIGSLNNFMFTALIENKVEFVELFLEHGFSLKNFVTHRALLKLYNKIPESCLLYKILDKQIRNDNKKNEIINAEFKQKVSRKNFITLKMIGEVIESLVGYIYKHKFTKLPFSAIDNRKVEKILNDTRKEKTIGILALENDYVLDIDDKCLYPEHELFLLNVLLCRYDMAKLFLLRGRNPMCSALIATKILKKYASLFEDNSTECNKIAENFELLACDILKMCHETNEIRSQFSLIRKIPEFDNCTCMQVAISSNDLNFIAQQCFQNVLIRIWYFKILPDTSKYLLLLCLIIPFLAPLIIDFRDKKTYNDHSNEKNNNQIKHDEESPELIEEVESTFDSNQDLDYKNEFFDLGISNKKNNYVEYLYYFLNTSFVKFCYHQIWYLLFLILFSYVLLCDFNKLYEAKQDTSLGLSISIPEVVLIIWVFTFLLDEIRKLIINERKIFRAIIYTSLDDMWKKINFLAILLFIVALVLRFIPNNQTYEAARIILSIDIILWFLKALNSYTFIRDLGPKLYMIREMLIQLAYFLLIVVLVMFAFGVSSHALMFKNQTLDRTLLKYVFFPAYFVIGGEYYTRNIIMKSSASQCTTDDLNGEYSECPDETGASVTLFLYVVYLVFLNILLVNLLIAIFNNTYDAIELEANKIWKSQRYALVFEYYHKPFLPPPFVLVNYIFSIFKFFMRQIRKYFFQDFKRNDKSYFNKMFRFLTKDSTAGFVYEFDDPSEENRLIKWEEFITDELITNYEKKAKDNFEHKIDQAYQKLDLLSSKFDEFLENGNQVLNEKIELIEASMKNMIQNNKK